MPFKFIQLYHVTSFNVLNSNKLIGMFISHQPSHSKIARADISNQLVPVTCMHDRHIHCFYIPPITVKTVVTLSLETPSKSKDSQGALICKLPSYPLLCYTLVSFVLHKRIECKIMSDGQN